MKKYLVIDMGGTAIKYGLVDEKKNIDKIKSIKAPTQDLDDLIKTLCVIRKEYEGQYCGVAVSMPGRIDSEKGIAYTGGAYAYICDIDMGKLFEELFGKKTILANDAKCAAKCEIVDGALCDVNNGAVLVLGFALGGAIMINKQLYMGSSFAAGEFSVHPDDLKLFNKLDDDLKYDYFWANYFSARGLLMIYKDVSGREEDINGYEFFERYDEKEEAAIKALNEFGKVAATCIYAIQSMLDLERIAIGGGISARKEIIDVIVDKVDEIYEKINFTPFCKPEIVRCKYANNANLLGALDFYREFVREK